MMNVSDNLKAIRNELPSDVTLVAVSKFHPVEAVMEAYGAGQRAFGESRPQELRDKAAVLPKDIEWHFIGHLQTNKIKYVVPNAKLIHSCDTGKLLFELEEWCGANGYETQVLLELHIAGEESKQGFSREEVFPLLEKLASNPLKHVKIRGVMGMASFTPDEAVIRREFAALMKVYEDIASRQYQFLEKFDIRSFGMSSDWKTAVETGATHIRVGTAIFGERKY